MANFNGGNRKGKHDIAPLVRAALLRAAARKSKDGDAVSYLATQFEKCLEEDFLGTLNAVGKYTVREKEVTGKVSVEHRHTHVAVSESLGWIAGLVEVEPKAGNRALTEPMQN